MPIYVMLSRLSQQGVQTLKANPDRLREVNRDVGFVNVVEAHDAETGARVSVALAARGSTRIEMLPALAIDQFIQKLG